MGSIEITRRRLEVQGFSNMDDQAIREIGPWVRWSTSFCAGITLVGTVMASPWILWGVSLTALGGVFLSSHPFDYLYNHGVRYLTGTGPLPKNGAPRKFACAIGTVWLVATGLAFHQGAMVTGYVLGGLLAATATLVSFTHICIPSMVYQILFGSKAALPAVEAS